MALACSRLKRKPGATLSKVFLENQDTEATAFLSPLVSLGGQTSLWVPLVLGRGRAGQWVLLFALPGAGPVLRAVLAERAEQSLPCWQGTAGGSNKSPCSELSAGDRLCGCCLVLHLRQEPAAQGWLLGLDSDISH